MKLKSVILFIGFSTCLSLSLFAQNREIVALDAYYRPIMEGQDSLHVHNRISSTGKDSSRIDKVFDLQNRMLRSSKTRFNEELQYNELVEERFDTLKNRVSIKYLNLDNGKFLSYYFKNGVQVSSLQFDGISYELLGEGMEEPIVTEYNPFTLTPKFDMDDYLEFMRRNLTYPAQAKLRGGTGRSKTTSSN